MRRGGAWKKPFHRKGAKGAKKLLFITALDLTGKTHAAVGRTLPSAWAIRGFQDIILRAADWKTVLVPAGMLVLYALGFYALAVLRFRSDAAQ